jgi:hypothetical protein
MRLNASMLFIGGVAAAMAATAYAALPKAGAQGLGEPLVNASGVPAAQAFSAEPALAFASLPADVSTAANLGGGGMGGEGLTAQETAGGQAAAPAATTPPTADQLAQLIEAAVNALPAGATAADIKAAVDAVLTASGASSDVQTAALQMASAFFASNASVSQALAGVTAISPVQQASTGYSPFANPQSTGTVGGGLGNGGLPSITVAPVIASANGTVAEGQPVIS